MDDFYAELKERAERMRPEQFTAWVGGPVLLLDATDQADHPWVPGSATSIESTVLFQGADSGVSGGDGDGETDTVRTARRLMKRSGSPDEPISIGRSYECDIVIDHHSISKVHAHICRREGGSFEISDPGSRNGVTVNGRRVHDEPKRLSPDDVIRIGAVMVRIVYPKQLLALLQHRTPKASMWRLLRDRTYAALWGGEAFTFLADSLYRIALVAWVMNTLGSGAALSALAIVTIIALMLTLLLGGVLVDRVSRARVLLISLALRAAVVVAVATIELHGSLSIWHLYAGAVLLGLGEALFLPAAAALLPEIVRREDLPSANALNTISVHGASIIGPGLAAVLGFMGGTSLAFSISACFFLVGSLCVFRLPVTSPRAQRSGKQRVASTSLKAAAKFMLGQPWLWVTCVVYALVGAINFATAAIALPVLIKTSLQIDMSYYGACQACVSVGALIASIYMGKRLRPHRRGLLAYALCLTIGIFIVSAGLPITIYGIAAAWLIRGAAMAVFGLIWVGTLQQLIPRDMLGRASSIDAFLSVSFMILTFLSYGWLTETIEPEYVFMIGGAVPVLAALLALTRPRIRSFQ